MEVEVCVWQERRPRLCRRRRAPGLKVGYISSCFQTCPFVDFLPLQWSMPPCRLFSPLQFPLLVPRSIWQAFRRSSSRAFHPAVSFRFPSEMETVHTTERLARLRELMKTNNVDVYSTMGSCGSKDKSG